MIYEAVLFWRQQPKVKKQEIAIDKETKQYYTFKIGQSLTEFLPCDCQTVSYPKELRNLLFEFYSECEKDESLYNVKYFLNKLSANKYSLPRSIPRYDEEGNEFLEYVLNKENEEKNKIDYMLAVAFELVMCKIPLKRCKACGEKWIVVYKTDMYYCKECAEIREKECDAIKHLLKKIKKKLQNIKQNYPQECKEYQDALKHETEIGVRETKNYKDEDKQFKPKKWTLTELNIFHQWLIDKRKKWYPQKRTKKNGNDRKEK